MISSRIFMDNFELLSAVCSNKDVSHICVGLQIVSLNIIISLFLIPRVRTVGKSP